MRNTPQRKAKRKATRRKVYKTALAVTVAAGGAAATYKAVSGHKTRSLSHQVPTPPRALQPKYRRIPKGNPNTVKHPKGTIFKGNRKGQVLKTSRSREAYNKERRDRTARKAFKSHHERSAN